MATDELGGKLALLASEIVDAATDNPLAESAVPLELKIDAFKAVSAYHVAYTRAKIKLPDQEPDPDGVDFNAFRTAVHEAQALGDRDRTGRAGTSGEPKAKH
jgi:hypothetical protein